MPSIWMTSKSRPERSDAIQSLVRAADSATQRREAADFDRPAPAGPGASPSGNRTDRANLRVATLISIWFMAHFPSQSSATAASQLGTGCSFPSKPRSLGRSISTLPPWKPILPFVLPQRCARRLRPRACRGPQIACASRSIISPRASMPEARQNKLEARRNLRQGLKLQRSRRNRSRCSKLVHGVAFLCGIITPSLAAQGEQRRFSYFNIERDNSLRAALIQYLSEKVMALGLPQARHWELIKGDHGQRLYWLILL